MDLTQLLVTLMDIAISMIDRGFTLSRLAANYSDFEQVSSLKSAANAHRSLAFLLTATVKYRDTRRAAEGETSIYNDLIARVTREMENILAATKHFQQTPDVVYLNTAESYIMLASERDAREAQAALGSLERYLHIALPPEYRDRLDKALHPYID